MSTKAHIILSFLSPVVKQIKNPYIAAILAFGGAAAAAYFGGF